MKPLISIIIRCYNQAQYLGAALQSVYNQTYSNWECIIINDGSPDNTEEIAKSQIAKDQRFLYFYKENGGVSSTRNFGLEKSTAQHIKWFDSDDIMLHNHLELSYKALADNYLDFVVTDTMNFDHENGKMLDKPYDFDRNKAVITAENYALRYVCYITDDFLGKREIVANITFNANITIDGDEYNFFVRILHLPINGVLINEVVTLRRIHTNSLSMQNGENSVNYFTKKANVKYQTAKDLVIYNNKKLIRWFLSGYIRYCFDLAKENEPIPFCKPAFWLMCRYNSFPKAMAFVIAVAAAKYFKKGYRISKYARLQLLQ